jgi:hypothetical protein
MAKVLVRVRPDNTYRVSRSEAYGENEELEVDEAELKLLPHCLVSVAADNAVKAEKLRLAHEEALANAAIFQEARESAIRASGASRDAYKIAAERSGELRADAEKRVAAQIEEARKAPPPKIAKPKNEKKPDLA